MRIAFITYEFPPDTADGGISTYTRHAATILGSRGHSIEVFAASRTREGTREEDGALVHRLNVPDPREFASKVGLLFERRHLEAPFDVLEGPDFMADARDAVRRVPDIPLVVRIHCPSSWIWRVEAAFPSDPAALSPTERDLDPEYGHLLDADEWVAPSRVMAAKLATFWGLDEQRFSILPNPYVPEPELLELPVAAAGDVVTFLGRVDSLKGADLFARSVPLILARHPELCFRFVGPVADSPAAGEDLRELLHAELGLAAARVEFTGAVPPAEVPNLLCGTDLCVIPSLWENFPYVCLEAMAAGRGIVASNRGGMNEMLDFGAAGELVSPDPASLARGICRLRDDPERRIQQGRLARERVLGAYGVTHIAALQEASYARASERRRASGPRPAVRSGTASRNG